jgi:glycosyltransferase involved in cell wall biosynthesis
MPKKHVQRPKASVLLPVFNAERYLEEAVRSVLDQTFNDFECLLLNDGSTDRSAEILENFAKTDPRCKIHSWPNQGIVKTLNRGIGLANSDIIIRMDADDISRPQRFERQIEHLEAHPDCIAVGSRIQLIDESGLPICEFNELLDHADIDASHIAGNLSHITHPAVAIKKWALEEIHGYHEEFGHAQDLDLFLRLAEVGKLVNLPEVLLDYRQHSNSIGYRYAVEQHQSARKAAMMARIRRGIEPAGPPGQNFEITEESVSAQHRKWAWWALNASNLKAARKHAWRAFAANPFDPANVRLIACVLRGH